MFHSLKTCGASTNGNTRTILAKAYSIMRGDRDKEDAPLDKFLALCAPLMGMIAPGEYQSMMGWALGEKDKVRHDSFPEPLPRQQANQNRFRMAFLRSPESLLLTPSPSQSSSPPQRSVLRTWCKSAPKLI